MPPRAGPSDRSVDDLLIERAAHGDLESFDKLMARHYRRATAVAHQWCRDPASVSDVVAVSFLKAYRSAPAFRGECAFATWLHRIVFNSAMDANAGGRQRLREVPFDERVSNDLDRAACTEATAREERMNAAVARDGQWDALITGLRALAPDKRRLLLMSYARQASYARIGKQLGIAVGTVKSRLNRARAELRASLR